MKNRPGRKFQKSLSLFLLLLLLLGGRCPAAVAESRIVSVYPSDYGITAYLRSDGRVEIDCESQFDMERLREAREWENIVDLLVSSCIIGLKADGSVVSAGQLPYDSAILSTWRDVVDIEGCYMLCLGLKADGTVLVAGSDGMNELTELDWRNVKSIRAGVIDIGTYICGLSRYGKVLGFKEGIFSDDIVALETNGWLTLALRENGKAELSGLPLLYDLTETEKDVSRWKNVKAVYPVSPTQALALDKDGRVLTAGMDSGSRFKDWKDVQELFGWDRGLILGLKSDGTVLASPADLLNFGLPEDALESWRNMERLVVDPNTRSVYGFEADGGMLQVRAGKA